MIAGLFSAVIVTVSFSSILWSINYRRNAKKKKSAYLTLEFNLFFLEVKIVKCLQTIIDDISGLEDKELCNHIKQINIHTNRLCIFITYSLEFLDSKIPEIVSHITSNTLSSLFENLKPLQSRDDVEKVHKKIMFIFDVYNLFKSFDQIKEKINSFDPDLKYFSKNIIVNVQDKFEMKNNSILFEDFNPRKLIIDSKGSFWFDIHDTINNSLLVKLRAGVEIDLTKTEKYIESKNFKKSI